MCARRCILDSASDCRIMSQLESALLRECARVYICARESDQSADDGVIDGIKKSTGFLVLLLLLLDWYTTMSRN